MTIRSKVWVLAAAAWVAAAAVLIGCASAEVVVDDPEGGGFDQVAAAETAEAATTSTARVDYLDELLAAEAVWQAAGIASYELTLEYNEGSGGFQYFDVTVVDGQVESIDHTCAPERTCLRVRYESDDQWTVDGIFDSIKELAGENIPLAVVRFDEELGFPRSITTNSDESPIPRMYRIDSLTPIEE